MVPDNAGSSINDGDTTEFDSIEFTFEGTDSGVGVDHFVCNIDGGSDIDPCTSSIKFTNLQDGSHTFTVKAIDKVGNDPADSFTWTISTASTTSNTNTWT